MKHKIRGLSIVFFLVLGFLLYRQDVSKTILQGTQKELAAGVAATPAAENHPAVSGFVAVERVIDGDTIDVLQNGKTLRVRLIGINTPETVDPRKKPECFGLEASVKLHALLDGREVRLETDPTQGVYDKYGRELAYVFLPNDMDVNELMVRTGFAREYTYKKPYKFQKSFKAAESAARAASLGLWAPGACL